MSDQGTINSFIDLIQSWPATLYGAMSFRIFVGLVALFIMFRFRTHTDRLVWRAVKRMKWLPPDIAPIFQESILVGGQIVVLMTILSSMGVDVSGILAGLGVVGFAIGLAMKDSFSNFTCGVLLLLNQPFRIGDYLTVQHVRGPQSGIVEEVSVRYTTLRNPEDPATRILVPNSIVYNDVILVKDSFPEDDEGLAEAPAAVKASRVVEGTPSTGGLSQRRHPASD